MPSKNSFYFKIVRIGLIGLIGQIESTVASPSFQNDVILFSRVAATPAIAMVPVAVRMGLVCHSSVMILKGITTELWKSNGGRRIDIASPEKSLLCKKQLVRSRILVVNSLSRIPNHITFYWNGWRQELHGMMNIQRLLRAFNSTQLTQIQQAR